MGAVYRRRRRDGGKMVRRNISPAKLYTLYVNGSSLEQVARKFGVTRQNVHKLFKHRNLERRARGHSSEFLQQLATLYANGATLEEVAKKFGLTRGNVRQIFKCRNLKRRSPEESKKMKRYRIGRGAAITDAIEILEGALAQSEKSLAETKQKMILFCRQNDKSAL